MSPQDITSLVGTLGFPIVCCAALFWYITKTMKEFSSEIRASIDSLSKSLNENTSAMIKMETTVELMHRIGGEDVG